MGVERKYPAVTARNGDFRIYSEDGLVITRTANANMSCLVPGSLIEPGWFRRPGFAETPRPRHNEFASAADAVSDAVKELHSYDTPAIVVLPLESVEKTYLAWLLAETDAAK